MYLANERTFLTWMHSATFLSTASIAIIAYADHNPWSQLYGVMLLPVAIGFIVYAMVQCKSPPLPQKMFLSVVEKKRFTWHRKMWHLHLYVCSILFLTLIFL